MITNEERKKYCENCEVGGVGCFYKKECPIPASKNTSVDYSREYQAFKEYLVRIVNQNDKSNLTDDQKFDRTIFMLESKIKRLRNSKIIK